MKFIADAMLGRLAKWLRIMGCDVEYYPEIQDDEIVLIAKKDGRIILTRDISLSKRKWVRENHFFVKGNDFKDQLRQAVERFDIEPFKRFLTRCILCNTLLVRVDKAHIEEKVPPYVFTTCDDFSVCPGCGRIYWKGTHRKRIEEFLKFLNFKL